MHIVLIPDKFKGSLTAAQVREALMAGVRTHLPEARFTAFEASDGGDGFLDAVAAVRPLQRLEATVSDPLGRPVKAAFGWDPEQGEAFVEMAAASGLVLLSEAERDAMRTHTRGTGELIRAALDAGAHTVYVGLGGSATSDGGTGLAAALGYAFLDASGKTVEPCGGNLSRMVAIRPPEGPVLPEGTRIFAVNDVSNPLWGPNGAARVYAPQKGAGPEQVRLLDAGLRHLDALVQKDLGSDQGKLAGAGAAGGTAFGLRAFLGAEFLSGTHYLFRITGFAEHLSAAPVDLILTGEGKIDGQSLQGKLLDGVLQEAALRGIPVVAVCGACDAPLEDLKALGLKDLLVTADPGRDLAWNMAHGFEQVQRTMAAYAARHLPIGS